MGNTVDFLNIANFSDIKLRPENDSLVTVPDATPNNILVLIEKINELTEKINELIGGEER